MGLVLQIGEELKAVPELTSRVRDAINRPDSKRIMGRSIAQSLKDHFFARDARGNSLGGARTHYWARAAKAVQQPQIQSDGLSVSINQVGIGLRYFGGTVRPGKNTSRFTGKPTQYLTIPARAEAYGKRAGEFHNLRVLFGRGGKPVALVERVATTIKRTRNGVYRAVAEVGGGVMFWLVKQVTFRADPTALPAAEKMTEPALSAVVAYLERIWARQSEGAPAT